MFARWFLLPMSLAVVFPPIAGPHALADPRENRSTRSAPDTLTTSFDVNGLQVILRRNTANDVVAANLYLLGGTQQLTTSTQGIETFLLLATERGTQHYPGAAMREVTANLGSKISVGAGQDWTTLSLRCVRTSFDSSWNLLADRVLHPTLAVAEVEVVRNQLLSGLRGRDADPDRLVESLADSVMFAGHPYGLAPEGTERSLTSLTAAQLRQYQQATFLTSRMLLVVVGNVERTMLEQLVRRTLASLPRGDYKWQPPPQITAPTRALAVRAARLPTNYLIGYYAGPPASSTDFVALRLASAALAGRFFTEIRSKQNLSYAPEAPVLERAIATGG